MRAYTRAVSPRLAECELTHIDREPIDIGLAVAQHRAYEETLARAGYDVRRLPQLDDAPDGVFVEDTALLLGDHAVITRPGVASRAGEVASTAVGLAADFIVHPLQRGHLDGGDVLRIGRTLYVGLSTRTDAEGVEALSEIVRPLGYEVVTVAVGGSLHLKTAATFAGEDESGTPLVLHNPRWVEGGAFKGVELLPVPTEEPFGAHCLRAGEFVLRDRSNLRTTDMLRSRGYDVIELDVSELQKAEAGLTCMSLLAD